MNDTIYVFHVYYDIEHEDYVSVEAAEVVIDESGNLWFYGISPSVTEHGILKAIFPVVRWECCVNVGAAKSEA